MGVDRMVVKTGHHLIASLVWYKKKEKREGNPFDKRPDKRP
jgi:hypothetical protein